LELIVKVVEEKMKGQKLEVKYNTTLLDSKEYIEFTEKDA